MANTSGALRKITKLAQMAAISALAHWHFVAFCFCSSGAGGVPLQWLLQRGLPDTSYQKQIQDVRFLFSACSIGGIDGIGCDGIEPPFFLLLLLLRDDKVLLTVNR